MWDGQKPQTSSLTVSRLILTGVRKRSRSKLLRTANCNVNDQMPKSLEKRRIAGAAPQALSMALSLSICLQLVVPHGVLAQDPPAEINIVVVDGEGAVNNVGQRSARDPLIRVEDENQKPISGAAVVFTLPTDGASGLFGNGDQTLIVTTDQRGQASASNLKVNQVPGKLQIHVSASFRGRTARANITQFSMSVPGKRSGGSGKTLLIVLLVAGAAAAGGVVATSQRRSTTGSPAQPPPVIPISITPGPGTIGGPR